MEKQLATKMSQYDCKHARLQQPPTTKIYNGRRGMGNAFPNKPATKRSTNHTVKYRQAAHTLGRLLTIAKGRTLATRGAECTHCR